MQLWQTIQTEQNCKVGMSAGGLPRPLMEDSGGPTTNWLRTIQIDNASNGHISSSQASHGGQAAGMSALLPFVRQYAFSNPNFGSSTAGGNSAPGSATTTTTRHFAAWEQTTTHFPSPPTPQQPQNLGQHTHPALLASVNLKASPVIRPIPSRLNTSPGPKPELLGPPLKPPPVKLGEWIFACLYFSSSTDSSSAIFANYLGVERKKEIRVFCIWIKNRTWRSSSSSHPSRVDKKQNFEMWRKRIKYTCLAWFIVPFHGLVYRDKVTLDRWLVTYGIAYQMRLDKVANHFIFRSYQTTTL